MPFSTAERSMPESRSAPLFQWKIRNWLST